MNETQFDRYRSTIPAVGESHPELQPAIELLDTQQDEYFQLFFGILGPNESNDGSLFLPDFIIISAINRAIDLIQGFRTSYPSWNFTVAAPLVRLQIDNLLRVHYLTLCPADSGCAELLLSAEPLRRQFDLIPEHGKKPEKLHDIVLLRKAEEAYPWLKQVYDKASGWVHFSSDHHGQSWKVEDDGTFYASCPPDISMFPYDFVEQLLWAMNEVTHALGSSIAEFVHAKHEAQESWGDEFKMPEELRQKIGDAEATRSESRGVPQPRPSHLEEE